MRGALSFRSVIQAQSGRTDGKARRTNGDKKNAGLKVVTLIATLNPVSQVLW